jgi:uncharacterized protein with gpF-like domain
MDLNMGLFDKIKDTLGNVQQKAGELSKLTVRDMINNKKEKQGIPSVRDDGLSNQQRMESLGLKLYVWSTSGDERVCKGCQLMEGKLCRWESPLVYSDDGGKTWKKRPEGAMLKHPGENACEGEKHCRCTALSYEKEFLGEM